MTLETLSTIALALAALPCVMAAWNLILFRRLPRAPSDGGHRVSVLIPARDEEDNIADAVESVLQNTGVEIEVIVLDDHSSDRTRAIVEAIAARDSRLRIADAPALPPGWSGKQHACRVLATLAQYPVLTFMDADVRLSPDALRRIAHFIARRNVGLVSGFPHEETRSFFESLVVPFIHILLLGYLPIWAMRLMPFAAFAAGCGQLIAVRRGDYEEAGGHDSIRASRHDGIMLPRAFRNAGLATDIFDATDTARCRMYRGAQEVWQGFSKNADEGMATPIALPVWTVLLAGGHILPFVLLLWAYAAGSPDGVAASAVAILLLFAFRLALAIRFRQSWTMIPLHPVGVGVLLALQWNALIRNLTGRPISWRGRSYGKSTIVHEE